MKTAQECLAENLKRLRKERGFTQLALAETIDISPRSYQKYEQLESFPDDKNLDRLGRALGVSVAELFAVSSDGSVTPLSAEDLGRAVKGLIAAGPVTRAYVLFLATNDTAFLERLTPQQRRALAALPLPS